jgi:glucosamine-6-phosphate deaminase
MTSPIRTFSAGAMQVHIFPSKREASEAAAAQAAAILRDAIAHRGRARMVVSTGNSQLDFIDALVQRQR